MRGYKVRHGLVFAHGSVLNDQAEIYSAFIKLCFNDCFQTVIFKNIVYLT